MKCKIAFGGEYDWWRCNNFKWKFIDIKDCFFAKAVEDARQV
jgi:hypothetical protein